ncbi:uncharacterized protein LOC120071179 [Benincasa hispida]|uniref:uncharacterized protein LOC120071179 n=1 Tax=Benincasa hispida TaxID=102211 RepID=UPI0019000885|nr:uncharacterized protein LOC120071179 [Benincasa hispida]
MKRKTFVTLNTSEGSLKVKRHDVIFTNPQNGNLEQEEGETSCHHITITEESEEGMTEEEVEDAPQGLEDGGRAKRDMNGPHRRGNDDISIPKRDILLQETLRLWVMFFDGATQKSGAGAGIVLISPEKHMLPYSFTLAELCSNVAKYQALIIGLQMALEIGVACIENFGDSKLIINKLLCQYEVKHDDLKPYFTYVRQLMEKLKV